MDRKTKAQFQDQKYNIMVTGRHVNVTEAMKAYAIDKLSKLDRIAQQIIDVNVIMDIQKLQHRVDIIMKYGHTIIKSTGITTDMYISVDQAVAKLESQLKRYMQRLHDWHAKNRKVIEVPERVYQAIDEDEANVAIEKEVAAGHAKELPHRILRTEKQPLKILTDQEAIMKMELSGAPCIVYRCEEDEKLKVIYRREDGHYGVISPE
jgi:putative sigma-54 modulation protein